MKSKAQIQFLTKTKVILLRDMSIVFDGLKFTVKKHYVTDGASVPRFLWSIFGSPFSGDTLDASILHDIFYQTRRYSRFTCDWNYLFIMKKYRVNFIKRWAYFIGVRIGGWFPYGFHKAGTEERAKMYLQIRRNMV